MVKVSDTVTVRHVAAKCCQTCRELTRKPSFVSVEEIHYADTMTMTTAHI